jgi:hypothetical protein
VELVDTVVSKTIVLSWIYRFKSDSDYFIVVAGAGGV